MTAMPAQRPGTSRQDYETPPEFIAAVKNMLGIEEFGADLAANESNRKADFYLTAEMDSLSGDWQGVSKFVDDGWLWLNPPFNHIAPWVKKCAEAGAEGVKIALLVPASVGSEWFKDYVKNHAYVFELNGRLSFDGVGPYPKDCVLALYGTPFRGSATWNWRKYVPEVRV